MVDKKIISNSGRLIFESGNGTHKYDVVWQGDWSIKELIDYCDGGKANFGGRVENIKPVDIKQNIYEGRVNVYYD